MGTKNIEQDCFARFFFAGIAIRKSSGLFPFFRNLQAGVEGATAAYDRSVPRSCPRVEPEGMLRRIMRQGILPNPALFATAGLCAAGLAFQAACSICSFEASSFFSLEVVSFFGFATGAA
jgi:hypothetical protein